ncbi:MAG: Na(+)-translocating NADH-quinone reductase subunit A [Gammaproteobacteria bacterium]|nr:Na(+)-translocating NADH-quinone reductase subunit A [Gammaproteobacteria bacterium]
MIRTKRGLDLPIAGSPEQTIELSRPARSVALLAYDYQGLKPTMEVAVGDRVVAGQLVFTDKKNPGVKFTAPASGDVAAINRGAKRVFQSLVIDVDTDGDSGAREMFAGHAPDEIDKLDRDTVVKVLVDSGQWTAIRSRPYSKIPAINSSPHSIFVTAMDSRPLTADPQLFINEQKEAFLVGIGALSRLTEGTVYVCSEESADIPQSNNPQVRHERFAGPHPSGLAGTHIHFLDPVNIGKTVWTVGYQDVIAMGQLFLTGRLFFERVVSLAGPDVDKPRLLRTRLGASTDELAAGELSASGEHRIISGSVLDGKTATGAFAYLGRFHHQVSVLQEGTERELLGFIMPGVNKFSLTRLFVSSFLGKKKFSMTTSTGGSERAMVPLGTYEEIMPLDILPTQLLRSLLVSDFDSSIELGCLELDEDDLALCTFACPGKYEYGPYLRRMLNRIEAEG